MKYSNEELNTTAMQIILHAGNGRTILNSIFDQLDGDAESLLKEAKKEITEANKLQTEVLQRTIHEENFASTLLFSHAQDTLMSIYSEYHTTVNLLKLKDFLQGKKYE